ncbi:MAG: hypothetical protein IT330_09955 [Anaerolineae bacterium]|nr:hypothetical protein [Anaerolineae bacterium]
MSYISSSARRRAAFVEAAGEIYDYLEKWYVQNPNASPHEVALETSGRRQQLMRKAVSLLSSSQGTGFRPQIARDQKARPMEPGLYLDLLA